MERTQWRKRRSWSWKDPVVFQGVRLNKIPGTTPRVTLVFYIAKGQRFNDELPR